MYETKSRKNNNNVINKWTFNHHMIAKFNNQSDVPHDIYCHTPIEKLKKQMPSFIKIKHLIYMPSATNTHASLLFATKNVMRIIFFSFFKKKKNVMRTLFK